MKKILAIAAIGILVSYSSIVSAAENLAAPELENKMEQLWSKIYEICYSPKTSLFYTRKVKDVPPPEDMKALKPLLPNGRINYMGGGSGMEDCSMLGGIFLVGLCDKYTVKSDAETAERARKIAKGLILADTVHGDAGFVARGVSPADGKTIYPETSRDQYTHNIHGLWHYYNSPIPTVEEKAQIKQIFMDVAEKMHREIRADTTPPYTYKLHGDVPDIRGVAKMGDVYPHEAARLAMLYAAAYDATKEKKYYDWYSSVYNEAVKGSAEFLGMDDPYFKRWVPPYSIAQMMASLELIREVETNKSKKHQINVIMDALAQFVDKYYFFDPTKKSLRDSSEIMWGKMLAKGYKLSDDNQKVMKEKIEKTKLGDSGGTYTIHGAYWRARVDSLNKK